MGYSQTAASAFASEALIRILQDAHGDCGGSSNSWGTREQFSFFEHGREREDGAETGTVYSHTGRKVGSYRIEPDGTITRFPGSTAAQRKLAEDRASLKYSGTFCRPSLDDRARRVLQKLWKRIAGDSMFMLTDETKGWSKVYANVTRLVCERQRKGYWDFTGTDRLLAR